MVMHWRVKACRIARSLIPFWRVMLSDGSRSYGELFTLYQLQGVRALVRYHDRLYPVKVSCTWSQAIEINARAALERAGLSVLDSPISL